MESKRLKFRNLHKIQGALLDRNRDVLLTLLPTHSVDDIDTILADPECADKLSLKLCSRIGQISDNLIKGVVKKFERDLIWNIYYNNVISLQTFTWLASFPSAVKRIAQKFNILTSDLNDFVHLYRYYNLTHNVPFDDEWSLKRIRRGQTYHILDHLCQALKFNDIDKIQRIIDFCRVRQLTIFHNTPDFWRLKQAEKFATRHGYFIENLLAKYGYFNEEIMSKYGYFRTLYLIRSTFDIPFESQRAYYKDEYMFVIEHGHFRRFTELSAIMCPGFEIDENEDRKDVERKLVYIRHAAKYNRLEMLYMFTTPMLSIKCEYRHSIQTYQMCPTSFMITKLMPPYQSARPHNWLRWVASNINNFAVRYSYEQMLKFYSEICSENKHEIIFMAASDNNVELMRKYMSNNVHVERIFQRAVIADSYDVVEFLFKRHTFSEEYIAKMIRLILKRYRIAMIMLLLHYAPKTVEIVGYDVLSRALKNYDTLTVNVIVRLTCTISCSYRSVEKYDKLTNEAFRARAYHSMYLFSLILEQHRQFGWNTFNTFVDIERCMLIADNLDRGIILPDHIRDVEEIIIHLPSLQNIPVIALRHNLVTLIKEVLRYSTRGNFRGMLDLAKAKNASSDLIAQIEKRIRSVIGRYAKLHSDGTPKSVNKYISLRER